MLLKKTCFLLLAILFLTSCSHFHDDKIIVLQPIGNFSKEQAVNVLKKLQIINPNILLRNNIPFPKSTYYEPRNRYRADSLIKYLRGLVGK
jgi:archaemetzincin